jgi:hypothetical protein
MAWQNTAQEEEEESPIPVPTTFEILDGPPSPGLTPPLTPTQSPRKNKGKQRATGSESPEEVPLSESARKFLDNNPFSISAPPEPVPATFGSPADYERLFQELKDPHKADEILQKYRDRQDFQDALHAYLCAQDNIEELDQLLNQQEATVERIRHLQKYVGELQINEEENTRRLRELEGALSTTARRIVYRLPTSGLHRIAQVWISSEGPSINPAQSIQPNQEATSSQPMARANEERRDIERPAPTKIPSDGPSARFAAINEALSQRDVTGVSRST